MRKIVLAALCSTALASAASAGDLAAPAYTKAPVTPVVAPVYDWTGVYLGLSAGMGWERSTNTDSPLSVDPGTGSVVSGSAPVKNSGGLYGGQIGYNYQVNNWVFGAETDLFYAANMKTNSGGSDPTDSYYGSNGMDAYGTVRARVGYAFDRIMPYLTGGLAYGHESSGFGCDANRITDPAAVAAGHQANSCQNATKTPNPGIPLQINRGFNGQQFYASNSSWNVGWTLGGGVEVAVSDRWSIKAEYDYADLGSNSYSLTDPNGTQKAPNTPQTHNYDYKTTMQTLKFGVNYRFN